MWRRWARAAERALAAFGLLAALTAAGQAQETQSFILFPDSEQVFRQPAADPRQVKLAATYYRLGGQDTSDVALGHSWGVARWTTEDRSWAFQTNIEAMAYSRFLIGGSVNQFETVDFHANLPVALRHGRFSARLMLFHESSHLGDDYIRRTRAVGFRYSTEGVRAQLAYDAADWLRLYCGASYLLHTIPDPARKASQWGFELTSPELDGATRFPMRLYLAQDFQSHEDVAYNVNSNTEAGVMIGFKGVKRFVKVYGAYFEGHSSFGQFYRQSEHTLSLGVSFHI